MHEVNSHIYMGVLYVLFFLCWNQFCTAVMVICAQTWAKELKEKVFFFVQPAAENIQNVFESSL